jgi:HSP20 family molecular chaperone IbpA
MIFKADSDKATAKFTNGVLSVTIPKKEPTKLLKSRKIFIVKDDLSTKNI